MFIDNIKLTISSGKGGAGAVSFRHEKFAIKGGPDGGDGGNGGNVIFQVDKNSHTLSKFRGLKHIKAKNGIPGMGRKMYGKRGEDVVIKVPPGTQVIDTDTGAIILDLLEDGYEEILLKGGKGGLGNWHFRSSTNQKPTYAQPGLPGESLNIKLELKLIADVGLVGFPNVGKSTLISSISNAKPEIANYEFTTLTPKLGVVTLPDFDSFVMADIPGIIEGASDGKGLGIDFLRHIERTEFLLFMLDITNYRDLNTQYEKLRIEIDRFSKTLSIKKFAIAITKIDSADDSNSMDEFISQFGLSKDKDGIHIQDLEDDFNIPDFEKPLFIIPISSVTKQNVDKLKYMLLNIVKKEFQSS